MPKTYADPRGEAPAPPVVRIKIGVIGKAGNWIARLVIVCCMQVGVIGIGTVAGSPAMQWCGFAVLMAVVWVLPKREPAYTPQEAANKLLADYGVSARG